MRRIIPAILALAVLTAAASPAMAEEAAKYNFASSQGAKNIQVIPGGEGAGVVYFYNIDGNRITHVTLEIAQSPPDWQVEIQPPPGETQVEVNGQMITVTENLYIEPSEALTEEAEPPDGMICIPVATRGYALAKEARINVKVPAGEEIGTKEEIVIAATATWLGQGGAVALNQARDFTYTVEVVSDLPFEEKIIRGGGIGKWWPAIAGAAAIIAGMTVFLLIRRRRG